MMTKKDFEAIAAALKQSGAPAATVKAVGDACAAVNPLFKATRFKIAATADGPVARYLATFGNVCPVAGCGGSVEGTGEQEWLEDEVAVARECLKCGATWDDFYQLADISEVKPRGGH